MLRTRCSFNGRQYVDGSEFTLDTDPCMTCLCHNTVMTCEQKKCFSVCDNPVSVPGQCCPVCPTCNYQGRDYREGETFQPRGDACDVCTCSSGHLNCHHKVCPRTATCPPNQIISPLPGECCPTCAGLGYNCSRTDIGQVLRTKPSDACFKCECRAEKNWMCTYDPCPPVSCPPSVQIRPPGQCCPTCPACHDLEVDRWYEEGTSWSGDSDPCVHCECQNGDVMCHVIGCPAVVCNRQQRFVRPPGKCCAMCEDLPAIPCQYQGSVYQAGEKWRVDDCTECRCMGREVECLTQKCPPLDCDPSDVASATPGSCCPVCVTRPGTCLVFGDPHYYTFDGSTIHFQGFCQYTMATDCVNNDFAVDVHHDNRGISGHVSWAQNFTVTLGQNVIHLLQNHVVEVDGRRVELPFYNQKFSVEHNQDSVLFNTKLGVKLVWNGNSYAELSVPGTYRDKLCGLCGNFNGFPMDDLKTKGGRITNSPSIFGNSWKTSQQENSFCEDGTDRDPCVEAGYRARKFANTQCSILRGPKFSRCHRTVAPDPFYAACVYDLCVCGDNSTCLCDILSSYAKECAKAGVRLEWREPGLCDFGCDESLGFVFDECGPVCPRTCENYDTPIGDLKTKCFKPCIASCQCPADKVLLNGQCVAFDECPRIDRGDIPVGPAQG